MPARAMPADRLRAPAWGWAGTAGELLESPDAELLAGLEQHHRSLFSVGPSGSQLNAWRSSIVYLRDALRAASGSLEVGPWGIALEYELPLEGGRRPDAVVLAGSGVVVVEFKESSHLNLA